MKTPLLILDELLHICLTHMFGTFTNKVILSKKKKKMFNNNLKVKSQLTANTLCKSRKKVGGKKGEDEKCGQVRQETT